jgi:soluble lytic murein transglycosylase-like protein
MAICERESCCIANIYGDNGRAYGIMQVQVKWVQDKLHAHGYTNEDMLYAQNNIVIGVEILKDHINTGNGMWWAVMAYNGGPQAAGSPATQEYASWVFTRAEELRGCPL